MTTLAIAARKGLRKAGGLGSKGAWRPVVVLVLAMALFGDSGLRDIVIPVLADAYLQVSVFVAATFALFALLERWLGLDPARLFARYSAWQVPGAALLGTLPGCGAAVMVVTQYLQGRLSFGALVAVLTSTMGDAAFLLLAREPGSALLVFAISLAAGSVTGFVVDKIHGPGFLRPRPVTRRTSDCEPTPVRYGDTLSGLWLALLLPGLVLGVLAAFQVDTAAVFGPLAAYRPDQVIGAAGALLSILLWSLAPSGSNEAAACRTGGGLSRTIQTTNFVTVWVIAGFLVFELTVAATGVELGLLFETWAPLVPLLAVLVGFLPGCGPQIVVTGLYLSGALPFSAQLANAISNDGDALFPALALAPRAALVATLYSAIPALLLGYGAFFLSS